MIKTEFLSAEEDGNITYAANLIKAGQLVAFPTETVYGLGADALNEDATLGIFYAKGRPADNPLIVHVADMERAREIAFFNKRAELLAEQFWPGPMTLVLPRKSIVPDIVTAGLDTVAVRMPNHPVALELIRRSGCVVAAPSANSSGRPSPTEAKHVWKDLVGKVACILDGGSADIGVESTVIDLSQDRSCILRPGGLAVECIREVLGKITVCNEANSNKPVRSPGMKYRHYAPEALVWVVEGETEQVREKILQLALKLINENRKPIVLTIGNNQVYEGIEIISLGTNEVEAASRIFSALREADERGTDVIIVEGLSDYGLGLAVMNRVRKAAVKVLNV